MVPSICGEMSQRERERERVKKRNFEVLLARMDLRRTLWRPFGCFDRHTPLCGWLYPAPVQ